MILLMFRGVLKLGNCLEYCCKTNTKLFHKGAAYQVGRSVGKIEFPVTKRVTKIKITPSKVAFRLPIGGGDDKC